VLLIARHLPFDDGISLTSSIFNSPALLETALRLDPGAARVDWWQPDAAKIWKTGIAFALLAERLAKQLGGCDPACAWIGGLLAPLGWQSICAVDPEAVGDCLRLSAELDLAGEGQRQLWTYDSQEIGRRLARRWKLPGWLRAIVGYLGTPADLIADGADDRLFRVLQLAVLLAQANGHDLRLPVGTSCDELIETLGLSTEILQQIGAAWKSDCERIYLPVEPDGLLLNELLTVAVEKRRMEDGPFAERLEEELDQLQQILADQRVSEEERLHGLKLRALAELAAGAGHEINNPLAVISGQSQYLLTNEEDPDRQGSLRAIVRQAERIHQILRDLMQFARPPQPRRQRLDLRALLADVVGSFQANADARGVRLEIQGSSDPATVFADQDMMRTALGSLVRNAVEAAPTDGWVRVRIEDAEGAWQLVVEDSGPGPQVSQKEHLFDPFYSGRLAGRGRGLGLSTAWRFAHEHGGDVRFDPQPDCPARFILILPRLSACPDTSGPALDEARERLSA
jgi:signal transduction histidine kinase